jgi:hypothetical protein
MNREPKQCDEPISIINEQRDQARKVIKSPSEINAINREFWRKTMEEFGRLADKYPHRLKENAARANRDIRAGHIADVAYAEDTGLEAAMLRFAALRKQDISIETSLNAQAPRPKKHPTVRNVAIEKMTLSRAAGDQLRNFLDAAEAGSVEDLSITFTHNKYTVDAGLDREQVVASRTLKDWWKAARPKSRAD